MTPDYERAAIAATETLMKYKVSSAPVDPLPILKRISGVFCVSFETMSRETDQDRRCMISTFGEKNQDAFTAIHMKDGKPQYLVAFNAMLPAACLQRALARELGHILLGHIGKLPEEIRQEEAKCFAHHLICPRPLIHSIRATGLRITTEMIGNLTGCYDYCLSCIRRQPAVHVPAELNRAVRDQFLPYVKNFFEFQRYASLSDGSALADFGHYMEEYEE